MTHPERVYEYLEHTAQAIDRATHYIEPLPDADALQREEQVQDAVVRNIEIIGEAANRIHNAAPDFMRSHPALPWVEMRGMRNKTIHEYFDVDWNIVWLTIKNNLPHLKQQIDGLLIEVAQSPEDQMLLLFNGSRLSIPTTGRC
jgi:uncharacterized protein with HEPN domain